MMRAASSMRAPALVLRRASLACTSRGFTSSLPCLKGLAAGPETGTAIPIGITKDGQDPVVKDDSEYPDWLFEIGAEDPETTEEMLAKGLKNLSYAETKKLFRMLRRDKIRKNNAAERKLG